MAYITLADMNIENKAVLLRADLNVPVQNGQVTDTTRIDRLKPTIDFLKEHNAKIIIASHFGRPKGQVTPEYSLSFLQDVLKERWSIDVGLSDYCIGSNTQSKAQNLKPGQALLLENLRFHSEEEANNAEFAQSLSQIADIYINDAFSACHRAHASIDAITNFLPSAAGLLVQQELDNLEKTLNKPEKPLAAVVGGAKVSTKLSLLSNLVKKVNYLILGGGMANTFLLARDIDVGNSLAEPDMVHEAERIMDIAYEHDCQIVLPIDVNCAEEFKAGAQSIIMPTSTIPNHLMVLDIGPDSIKNVKEILETCKTVIWNGPMGAFEIKPFDIGTNELAKVVASLTKEGKVTSIAGGGDTVAALDGTDSSKDFSYISTAGGAFLEWLEGKTLPGIAALQQKSAAAE